MSYHIPNHFIYNIKHNDMKFTVKIIKNGYQVTKITSEGTIRKFYYDLKKARELL